VLEQPVIQMLRLRRLRSRAGHKEGIVELAELVGESVEVAQRRERLLGKGRHLEARDELAPSRIAARYLLDRGLAEVAVLEVIVSARVPALVLLLHCRVLLLLNRALTYSPDGHISMKQWAPITNAIARELGKRDVVAILWGNDAKSLKEYFRSDWVIESAHPSPLSAYRGFFGSKPFTKSNEILRSNALPTVTW